MLDHPLRVATPQCEADRLVELTEILVMVNEWSHALHLTKLATDDADVSHASVTAIEKLDEAYELIDAAEAALGKLQ